MIKAIKGIFWPGSPNPDVIAEQMLQQANLELLNAQSAKEHFDAEVSKLRTRIARLEQRRRDLARVDESKGMLATVEEIAARR
jgi:hypothetical protein